MVNLNCRKRKESFSCLFFFFSLNFAYEKAKGKKLWSVDGWFEFKHWNCPSSTFFSPLFPPEPFSIQASDERLTVTQGSSSWYNIPPFSADSSLTFFKSPKSAGASSVTQRWGGEGQWNITAARAGFEITILHMGSVSFTASGSVSPAFSQATGDCVWRKSCTVMRR